MAVTQQPAESLADAVKLDLQTPSTTSHSTLNLLRALLGLNLVDTKDPAAVIPKPKKGVAVPAKASSRPPNRKPSVLRTKVKLDFEIHDGTSTPTQPLPLEKRKSLATETFNITLKQLSSKAKEKQNVGQAQSAVTPRTSPQNALQTRSPNRKTPATPKKKAGGMTKASRYTADQDAPLRATADCAMAALLCLDRLAQDTGSSSSDTSDTLIKGAQILLDKLIGLGLTTQAEEHVWQVRKQLCSRSGESNGLIRAKVPVSSAMIFETIGTDAKVLNMISTFQLQILKVGNLIGAGFVDQILMRSLDTTNSSNPVTLCLQAIESGVMTEDKAGQHLHAFSVILSRSCSAVRRNKHCLLNSLEEFQLTIAMLKIRCHSWKMLGHSPDVEKELWTPLSRVLQDYSETCDASHAADLGHIKNSITALQELLASVGQMELLPPSIAHLLVEVAQRCGSTKQALAFLGEELSIGDGIGGLAGVINRCRGATLVLGDATSDARARLASCELALHSLKSSLKGTGSELRDLLLHSARLRKAATSAALSAEKSVQLAQVHEDDISLQTCLIRLLYAITRFVLRYIDQTKPPKTGMENRQTQVELHTAVCSSARNTVDSVLSVMKCKNVRSAQLWDETEAALTECLELTNLIDESHSREYDKAPRKQSSPSVYLRISNIYWAWYLQDKDANLGTRRLCVLLERSIEAMEPCIAEERILAFEVVKCERVASCYQILRDDQNGKIALFRAIKSSVAQGALDEAMEIVLTKPARLAWTDPKLNAHILGSCLRKLGRASAECNVQAASDQISFFDDEDLPNLHRAQLLEIQLFAVAELPATASIRANCTSLAKRILNLCQQPQHHVYRIRFVRDVLNLAAKQTEFPVHDILDDELLQTACTFQRTVSTSPCFLTSYGPLLCLSVLLQWAFLTTRPSPECIRGLIDSTASLLSQCQLTVEFDAAVDNPDSLLRQLSAAADYAGMLDLVDIRLRALQAMGQVLRIRTDVDATRLAGCLTDVGSANMRLGNPLKAGCSFAEAEKLFNKTDEHTEARLNWCLAYSDYLISVEAYEKGAQMIDTARSIHAELVTQPYNKGRSSDKLKQESCLSHAALAVSEFAFCQGDLRSAITYARKCVKLTSGMWAALEKLFDGGKDHLEATGIDLSHTSVYEASNTTLSLDQSTLQTVVRGAQFWTHINIHFQALLHMSNLSAHCGLYPDAVYYASLASKMSALLTSDHRQLACHVRLAWLHAKGGQDTEAKVLMKAIQKSSFDHLPDLQASSLSLELATAALLLNDLGTSDHYLERAGLSISKVLLLASPNAPDEPSAAITTVKQTRTLTIAENKLIHLSKPRTAATKQKAAPAPRNGSRKPVNSPQGSSAALENRLVYPVMARLQEAQTTLALQIQLSKGELLRQVDTSNHVPTLNQPSASNEKKLVDAKLLLNQALAMFGSDAVHCVLAETALAYPSRYSARRPSGRVSALSATTVSTKVKKLSYRPRQKQQREKDDPGMDEKGPEQLLRMAYELLASAFAIRNDRSSSDTIHDVQKLFCRISMLANAVGLSLSYSPTKVLCNSLKPKDTMLLRECFVLDTDPPNSGKSELRKWPIVPKSLEIKPGESDAGQVQVLSQTFDDLPETWSLVSISLNDAKSEMLLSRATAGTTPLILRIPLARSAIDDAEENEFTFSEAKEELMDIIDNANLTAHDSRSQAEKAARKEWWAEREALDRRLETLLLNMENIWLGGFRGILSQQRKSDEEMLSRLSSSLDAALEKQLPSRQKTGGTSTLKVRLHAHILDLFISLGHPDENELDDAITDLLYFVVDILQFEGERNAYDEIDFDAILVDVLDALRSYHEASPPDTTARHTILILDKELHAFPWESMPCLLGKSVSRMPSMGMIRDRLAHIRAQSANTEAYTLSAASGGYVLNPSSDLASTEATFANVFTQQLSNFTSIVSRKPTELEFESLLRNNPLLLYFGHGSGAQYIRGRRIKQLDQCAVTFLMGCSSGKMTECGVYESHGMPWNYMHAGSMAVVGTLWDVTDRDIDRFAMTAFEEWGLLEGVQEDEKARKKTEARKKKVGARKVKKLTARKGKGQVTLDEAVNRARDACILRYLNGAAVVTYGLPVMLE